MNYLKGSFLFSFLTITVTIYYFYALDRMNVWRIIPGYFVYIFYLISVFLVVMAFQKKHIKTVPQKFLIIIPILINIVLTVILCIYLFFSMAIGRSFPLIQTETSPDEKIELNFYSFDAGGMGTFGVIGEVNGPLWFKKRIYYEKRIQDIEIEWIDNDTLLINKQLIELKEAGT